LCGKFFCNAFCIRKCYIILFDGNLACSWITLECSACVCIRMRACHQRHKKISSVSKMNAYALARTDSAPFMRFEVAACYPYHTSLVCVRLSLHIGAAHSLSIYSTSLQSYAYVLNTIWAYSFFDRAIPSVCVHT
jgi:hypothetical protein